MTGRGRPRSELDRQIFDAALRLLAAHGYQGLTMGAVAEAAGIGKPTLYRRYATKPELVVAVLVSLEADGTREGPGGSVPLPSDTRTALRELLGATAQAIATPGTMTILGSLLAEAGSEPELLAAFRDALFRPRHAVVHEALRRGIDQGDVRPDVDIEAVDAMLFGSLLARTILGEPVDEAWAGRVIDAAWPAITVGAPA